MSVDDDVQDDIAQRPHPVRRRLPSVVGPVNGDNYLDLSWAVSGALFGVALASVVHWSVPATVLAVAMAGALSWMARGIANLVLACIAVLVVTAAAFRAFHALFPGVGWSLSWLGPCALVGLVLLLLLGRRVRPQLLVSNQGAAVELGAAVVSILLAALFGARVSPAGTQGALRFLLVSEDNAAWIDIVSNQHTVHGVTTLFGSGSSIGIFGPVVATYLAGVRSAVSGVLPRTLPLSSSSEVVLSAYGVLIVCVPVIAALVVRVLEGLRRLTVTLLVWACVIVVLASGCMLLMNNAFLSAELALLLVLPPAYLLAVRPRLADRTSQVIWLAVALLLFGAGSAWVPVLPLAGAAIAACCVPVIGFAIRGGRRSAGTVVVLLAAACVLELELLQQYRIAAASIGGGDGLLSASGGTPVVTAETEALIVFLLLSFTWLSSSEVRPRRSAAESGYVTVLGCLLGYFVAVLLAGAWVTKAAPAYGPTKLEFVLSFVWVSLALIEFVSRLDVGRRLLRLTAYTVLAVVVAGSVQEGPIYEATASHWPVPAAVKPAWYDTVQREIGSGRRVLCLSTDESRGAYQIDAYDCSRFVASLQGKEDHVALNWRFVLLGRRPVSDAIADIKHGKDKPWTVIVTGPMAGLHIPTAWWAPIVRLPGLKFVPQSG